MKTAYEIRLTVDGPAVFTAETANEANNLAILAYNMTGKFHVICYENRFTGEIAITKTIYPYDYDDCILS